MNFQNYLRVGEAAKLLGVSGQTIRNWDRAGKLVGLRHPINGYRLYRRDDLDAILRLVSQSYEESGGCVPNGLPAKSSSRVLFTATSGSAESGTASSRNNKQSKSR
ncbi:MAG: MerR family DNA-binding transcriptional regulator [Pirellulaceae bacterium]